MNTDFKYIFSISETESGKWWPHGKSSNGKDEIWCDGLYGIENKITAEMIALNMEESYRQGWDDAMTHLQKLCFIEAPVVESGYLNPFKD